MVRELELTEKLEILMSLAAEDRLRATLSHQHGRRLRRGRPNVRRGRRRCTGPLDAELANVHVPGGLWNALRYRRERP